MSANNRHHRSYINSNTYVASNTFINGLIFWIIKKFHKFTINEIKFSIKLINHTKNLLTKLTDNTKKSDWRWF